MGDNLKIFKKNYNNVAGFIATDTENTSHDYIQTNTIPLTVEANGIYIAPAGTTYGPVVINVTDLSITHMEDVDLTSWEGLTYLSMSGNAPAYLEVGGTIDGTYTLPNGTIYDYPWIIVDFQTVELEDGTRWPNVPILQAKYASHEGVAFGTTADWSTSSLRQYLNNEDSETANFLTYIPNDIVKNIHPIKINYYNGSSYQYVYDKLWCSSQRQQLSSPSYYNGMDNNSIFAYYSGSSYSLSVRYCCNNTAQTACYWSRTWYYYSSTVKNDAIYFANSSDLWTQTTRTKVNDNLLRVAPCFALI